MLRFDLPLATSSLANQLNSNGENHVKRKLQSITKKVHQLTNAAALRFGNGGRVGRTERHSTMMTCLELALTAQLICLSDHTLVCTDNGSIAQLLDIPACTSTERSQPNDDLRLNQGPGD